VLERFVDLALEEEKIGVASVTSAVQLTEDQKERIRKKLLDTTEYTEMRVEYSVDQKLIGGLIIQLGDRVVDSSLSSKLAKMQRDLEAGI
jgi:F-type H+-transporting ATPase subunit delta